MRFCDECANFVRWAEWEREPPQSWTPCSLGYRELKFRMPVGHPDMDRGWGFYREGCRDYVVGFIPWRPGASPATLLREVGLVFGESDDG